MLARFETVTDVAPDAPLAVDDVEGFLQALRDALELPFDVPAFAGMHDVDLADEYAAGGALRLLYASAVFVGREAGELSVIRELDVLADADLDGTALGALLEPEELDGGPSDRNEASDAIRHTCPKRSQPTGTTMSKSSRSPMPSTGLSPRQRVAPLTVVTGPPGTGKSYTISALVLDHLLAPHCARHLGHAQGGRGRCRQTRGGGRAARVRYLRQPQHATRTC